MDVQSEDDDYLDYLITVDIFSEGTDIVEVNQVIMLRPTQSPIVFIQQLGRGLRKADGKEYVVILDFIGNYKNNLWSITNAKVKYSIDYGSSIKAGSYKKESEEEVLLTTGADTSFSLMNIYDLAGNVWEWTLEKASDDNATCARRGGNYGDHGSNNPAGCHDNLSMSDSRNNIGFRISIY